MGQRIDPEEVIFDFFAPDGQAVVVERARLKSFIWHKGAWLQSDGLAEILYLKGEALDRERFVAMFPEVDLRLLTLIVLT